MRDVRPRPGAGALRRLLRGAALACLALGLAPPAQGAGFTLERVIDSPSSMNQYRFGWSVDVSGGRIVVGMPVFFSGSHLASRAHLFDAATGALLHSLAHPGPTSRTDFGASVAISGDDVVVSAFRDDTGGAEAGVVFVFDASTGGLEHTLAHPAPAADDWFGYSVDVDGGVAVVGAFRDDRPPSLFEGSAHGFSTATGGLLYSLEAPGTPTNRLFGHGVAVGGGHVAVGAPADHLGADGAGQVYLFDAATGAFQSAVPNPTPDSFEAFGRYVAASATRFVAGAPRDDTGASDSGAAYVFAPGAPGSPVTLDNPTPAAYEWFGGNTGRSIAVHGDLVAVGVSSDDAAAPTAGAVYVFDATTGTLLQTLLNPDPDTPDGDRFGHAVALDDGILVVGAMGNDIDDRNGVGSVYVYRMEGDVDLAVTKSTAADPITLGDAATYLVEVTNNGTGDATCVTLTDELPPGSALDSAVGAPCTASGSTVTCDLGTLAAGDAVEVVLVATPGAVGAHVNTASVTACETDAAPADNEAQATVTVTAPPAPQSRVIAFREQDAILDEHVLRVVSVADDTVDQALYSHPDRFRFEFDRDGAQLAVFPFEPGPARILDAASGALRDLFATPAHRLFDVDFNPQDPTRYAIVGTETANSDQHTLFFFESGVERSRFDLPVFAPGLRLSRPRIAWSPDGAKLAGVFVSPAPAVNEYTLWSTRWNVINDAIVLPPVNAVTEQRPPLSNREQLRELVHRSTGERLFATDFSITEARTAAGGEQMGALFVLPNDDLDLSADGRSAVLIRIVQLAAGDATQVYGVSGLEPGGTLALHQGPGLFEGRSVAVSPDSRYAAVATKDRIFLYDFPDFTPVRDFPANRPANLEFRPLPP